MGPSPFVDIWFSLVFVKVFTILEGYFLISLKRRKNNFAFDGEGDKEPSTSHTPTLYTLHCNEESHVLSHTSCFLH